MLLLDPDQLALGDIKPDVPELTDDPINAGIMSCLPLLRYGSGYRDLRMGDTWAVGSGAAWSGDDLVLFDGTVNANLYAPLPPGFSLAAPWTVCGWLIPGSEQGGGYLGFSLTDPNSTTRVKIETNQLATPHWKIVSNGETPGTSVGTYTVGKEYFMAMGWDGTNLSLWVDAALDYSFSPTGSTWQTSTLLVVGGLGSSSASGKYPAGYAGLVRLYQQAPTAAVLQTLRAQRWAGLVAPLELPVAVASGGGDTHDLTVDELAQAVALDAPAPTFTWGFSASLAQAVTFDAATVVRVVGLTADALAQGTALDAATLTRLVGLTVDELTQAVALDAPNIARAIGLTVDSAAQAVTFDAATVTRILGLTAGGLTQAMTLDAAVLGCVFALGAQAMAQAATLDDPALGVLVNLTVDSLLSASTLDSVSINKAIQLTVDALAQTYGVDAPDVTRIRSLVVASLLQAQALDTVTLTRLVQLTVADMLLGQTLDGPALTRILGLTVNDLLMGLYLDSVILADAAPPKYLELAGVKVDLIELLAQKIDSLNLSAKKIDSLNLTGAQ